MQDESMYLKTARSNTSKNKPDGCMEGHQIFFFIKNPDMVNEAMYSVQEISKMNLLLFHPL